MIRKTWIKIKRGLVVDPKHRQELGTGIWLFLYMLDRADWETGKIVDWRDRDAADEMQLSITTIRTLRNKLDKSDYISCEQHSKHQIITIKKWINPREYSGTVINDDPKGTEKPVPTEEEGISMGISVGIEKPVPVHINHISHNHLIDSSQQDPKSKSDHQEIVAALELETGMDMKIRSNAGQIARASEELRKAGYGIEELRKFHVYWKNDWRSAGGTKPPTLKIIKAEIGFAAGKKKSGNNNSPEERKKAAQREIQKAMEGRNG